MSANHIYLYKLLGVEQSISRGGSYPDKVPIESIFGHMKNEVNFKSLIS